MNPQRLNIDKSVVKTTIPESFAGKNILITGFTGFMGKYLVMTILSELKDVGDLYLLMRETKNSSVQKKFEKAINNPLFDEIRKNNPEALKKLKIVEGDLTKAKLGVSPSDRNDIIENVSIVYHVAASVRFDMPLRTAILLNVKGTKELCDLVLELKKPSTFLHVSTSYCQIDKPVVEEIVYDPHGDWKQAIEIAENSDEFELNIICAKFMEGFPNTYTFTKSLAESLVQDMCKGKVATIIFRPTVVISAANGPIPGWTDNFNGPVGLCIGFGKGIIRSLYAKSDSKYDFICVDFAIGSMIKAVWIQQYLTSDEISVYNCSCYGKTVITPRSLLEYGRATYEAVPVAPVWHANIDVTQSLLIHYINVMLFHALPAVLADIILKASGNKPMLLRVQRKVFNATNAIDYFLQHSWDFYNHKCWQLDEYLLPSDVASFTADWDFDHQIFFNEIARVSQWLLLKEERNDDHYKKKRQRMKYIHNFIKYSILGSNNQIIHPVKKLEYQLKWSIDLKIRSNENYKTIIHN